MDLFTDLYFRKSQKKLYKTMCAINSAILDDHDGKKESKMGYVMVN